jgi:hypothetical protein
MKKSMLLALACMMAMSEASAEIRKSVESDGRVVVSNLPLKTATLAVQAPAMRRSGADNAGLDLLRPEVIGAVANVMGIAHLVSSSRTFCVATAPTSYKKYSSVADAWHVRNASVITQKEKVMSMGDQRLVADALSGDMVRKTEEMMRPVRGAGTAEKIAWCDKAFADVGRGDLDLVGRASIKPLMSYHPR